MYSHYFKESANVKKSWLRNVTKFFILLAVSSALIISPTCAASNYAEGEALVLLKNKVGTLSVTSLSSAVVMNYIAEVAARASAEVVTTYLELSAVSGEIFVLMRSEVKSTKELIAELKKNPNVMSASPNFKMYAAVTEPYGVNSQQNVLWNMQRIRAPEAWAVTTGNNNIYVAVLDSGIDVNHADLRPNIDMNLSRNFVNPTGSSVPVEDQDYDDKSKTGHGTHIAGIIAAVGNNSNGVVGVCRNTKLIALRVMNADNWAYHSKIVAAINYIVKLLDDPGLKIAALNLSTAGWHDWTPSDAKETMLWRALRTLDQRNSIVIVVAAGNESSQIGAPATIDYPGVYKKDYYCYPASYVGIYNMIVVGAIDPSNDAESNSNWSTNSVHLVAPGDHIYSTLPAAIAPSGYGRYGGTSKAAPHVAGAVALVAAVSPDLTASEIRDVLFQSANSRINPETSGVIIINDRPVTINPQNIPTRTLSKYGLLDVGRAVALAVGAPDPTPPPTNGGGDGGGGGCNAGIGIGILILIPVLWNIRKIRKIR